MEVSWLLILPLLYIIAALALISKRIAKQKPQPKLPPGPKPWPIIGNLNLIGSIPHQSFHFLSRKYGEIMLLKFGKFPVVVASSPEIAKQFLKIHDTVFASRPALAAGKYTSYNYSDMMWAPYGPYWRQTRKIYLSEVFSARRLESFEHIRMEEGRNFISSLRSLSGKRVVLRDHLMRLTLSTISRIAIGNKYFSESENEKSIIKMDELRGMLDEWFLLNGVFNIGDWIPWLSSLDLQGYVKKMMDLHKKLDRFLTSVIDDHLDRRNEEKGFHSKDVADKLLQLAEDPNLEVRLTRDCVKALVQNLLVGGTDTSATTVEWTLHEILRQPHILQKAKEELNRVIGRNRWVEENDCSQLTYIDAIIMESMRLHPLGTLLGPHYAIEDCKVAGYDISKGTTVLINTWSIGRDPISWDKPEEFLPERFIGKEIDMLGSNFALLPFGSGRRRCPGYNLGLKVVRTTLANLLHGFELKLVEGMRIEDICMEEEYGLSTHPKKPLEIIVEPTLSSHLC
ncbi:Cytochrome P450 CYP2 subfamily [Handroanthus impetiginosus]|uniref:Cytochrome P450 CYP2 subfamily n=1 Tax=Handroanthus impetiginosus TaxID=429701 RepID=A0A2G9GE24_9LAMI|nr:Cytochrome P450 CYP2 subfamily [Handroanthus impetiginosus]